MCNKSTRGNTTPGLQMQTRSMFKKQNSAATTTTTTTSSSKNTTISARRTRTKTRKPKYLSLLRLEKPKTTTAQKSKHHKQQAHKPQQQQQQQQEQEEEDDKNFLFGDQEKDMHEQEHEDNNVAYLFESSSYSSATLHELLSTTTTTTAAVSSDEVYNYKRGHEESDGACSTLVRTAMKGKKERDVSEEKWVVYSEVVEKKEEEVTSCAADHVWGKTNSTTSVGGLLSLKLDYEEILNAWSDKGSLYIHGESPQTVPDLFPQNNVMMDGWGSPGNIWRVPEIVGGNANGIKVEEDVKAVQSLKMGRRLASVLRYKEKRQTRLFAKRIRYEVRKLNAEKRPRMKGRFVKRS